MFQNGAVERSEILELLLLVAFFDFDFVHSVSFIKWCGRMSKFILSYQ